MRSIQYYFPEPRHTEINRVFVKAKPSVAWEAVRHFDASAISWIRLLFAIRTIPEKLSGKHNLHKDNRLGIDQIAENGKGFMIVHEEPGKEVVVASVGQFWQLNIRFADIRPEEFKNFNQPGWGKLAWAITVEPFLGGSTISLELRTTATDDHSWKKLKNYYRIIGLGSRPIRSSLMKHYEAVLGKMKLPDDDERILPGDELIPDAKYSYTHSKIIEAPITIAWHYLMQLGCDRAGWYSIDLLDHRGIPSTDHLVEGWDTREIGDKLDATLANDSFFEVYAVEKERYFIIGGDGHRLGGDFKMRWAFIVEPIGEDASRLTARVRMKAAPKISEWLQGTLLAPAMHGIMQEVQLKKIKRFSERDAELRKIPSFSAHS